VPASLRSNSWDRGGSRKVGTASNGRRKADDENCSPRPNRPSRGRVGGSFLCEVIITPPIGLPSVTLALAECVSNCVGGVAKWQGDRQY
jgi:hypothetical protein